MPNHKLKDMPASDDFSRNPEKDVFAWLDRHGLVHTTIQHTPTHTVEDSAAIKTDIKGAHTKNLFLKDKKGSVLLISALADTQIRLNHLHKLIGTARLSFAKPDLLWDTLYVTPGSVSAFALIHDDEKQVRFIVDENLLNHSTLNFHPLRNDMTTSISTAHFSKFLESTGRVLEYVNFDDLYPA